METSVTVKTGFPLKTGDRLLFKKRGRVEYSYDIGAPIGGSKDTTTYSAEIVDHRVKGNK